MSIGIPDAIATLAEAEERFRLAYTTASNFFPEWQDPLPALTAAEQSEARRLRRRYLYQRSTGPLSEGTITLLFASPLLAIAGLYDPPFSVRIETPIALQIEDNETILQGRLDALVLLDRLWIVAIEAQKATPSVWAALPQTLAYLMANPQPNRPSFAAITNGNDLAFIKLAQEPERQYDLSRTFSPFATESELLAALQVLKRIGKAIASPNP